MKYVLILISILGFIMVGCDDDDNDTVTDTAVVDSDGTLIDGGDVVVDMDAAPVEMDAAPVDADAAPVEMDAAMEPETDAAG